MKPGIITTGKAFRFPFSMATLLRLTLSSLSLTHTHTLSLSLSLSLATATADKISSVLAHVTFWRVFLEGEVDDTSKFKVEELVLIKFFIWLLPLRVV